MRRTSFRLFAALALAFAASAAFAHAQLDKSTPPVGGVVASAVSAMARLGARPDRMVAAVGPCIGPQSYEVGLDFLDRFVAEASGAERFFRPGVQADKRLFDLPGFVLDRLAEAGVAEAEWIGRDTLVDEADFFSNRRNVLRGEGDYGRLMSAVMLEG